MLAARPGSAREARQAHGMLPYQERIVEGLLRTDSSLVVLGRGLGAQEVLLEVARRLLRGDQSDARHATRLIFLIHTPQEEADLLVRRAGEDPRWSGCSQRLVNVGSDMGVEDRAEAYPCGGVFIVSARLLVPDLLSGRLVVEVIDGILVNHAHSVSELSAEAFVMRILRSKNKRGFIRAISDRPDAFAGSDSAPERVMRRCFAHHLEVWPRIREEVQLCLQNSACQPDVHQKTVKLPPREQEIQRRLLNIIESTLEELQRDPNVELGHLTVQGSLFQTFDVELRQALGPVWQNLGPRTRRTVQDLGGVRQLLTALPRCDAVEFHRLLESMSVTEPGRDPPAWLLSADAQALHVVAKARVYEVIAAVDEREPPLLGRAKLALRRTLEPHPKWGLLLDIIDQTVTDVARAHAASTAHQDTAANEAGRNTAEAQLEVAGDDSDVEVVCVVSSWRPSDASSRVIEPRIVVIVPDEWTKRQISSVLHHGPEATLLDTMGAYFRERSMRGPAKRQKTQQPETQRGPRTPEAQLFAREADAVDLARRELAPSSALQVRVLEGGQMCHPRVDIVSLDGPDGTLEEQLRAARPHTVVLSEPSLEAIRALEVYCAEVAGVCSVARVKLEVDLEAEECGGGAGDAASSSVEAVAGDVAPTVASGMPEAVKVFLFAFDESIEKYRFQKSILHESRAVDALIRARQSHTVRADDPVLEAELAAEAVAVSSRRGGGAKRKLADEVQPKVVVDMREFRSALPFMLYQRHLVVDPLTIPVGDYVLSLDICVERKAIPDLIQSLASGRLYQQAQNMCKYYANPCLLIEFDPGKSFALTNTYTIARREVDVGARDLLGKLSLVVLHFPNLRLIWSPSQSFTADIFLKLKAGRCQPNPETAARVDADDEDDGLEGAQRQASKINNAALTVLRKLPGVTPRNVFTLARKAGSLAGVAELSREALEEAMGKSNAQVLHDFIHAEVALRSEELGAQDAPAADAAPATAAEAPAGDPPAKQRRRAKAKGQRGRGAAVASAAEAPEEGPPEAPPEPMAAPSSATAAPAAPAIAPAAAFGGAPPVPQIVVDLDDDDE